MTKITADEFERGYAERSGISVERLRAIGRVVRPCSCEADDCEGWQSVSFETAADIDAHERDRVRVVLWALVTKWRAMARAADEPGLDADAEDLAHALRMLGLDPP